MSIETVKKAKEVGAIGVKDSSGDMFYLYSLIEEFKDSPEFSIMAGTELYLPDTIIHGGHGAIPGGANTFPKLFVDLYNASARKDLQEIEKLRNLVFVLYNTIYNVGDSPMKITKGIKCSLSVLDICDGYMAHPLRQFEGEERKLIEKYVGEFQKIS